MFPGECRPVLPACRVHNTNHTPGQRTSQRKQVFDVVALVGTAGLAEQAPPDHAAHVEQVQQRICTQQSLSALGLGLRLPRLRRCLHSSRLAWQRALALAAALLAGWQLHLQASELLRVTVCRAY